jgi:hypothetical protein
MSKNRAAPDSPGDEYAVLLQQHPIEWGAGSGASPGKAGSYPASLK